VFKRVRAILPLPIVVLKDFFIEATTSSGPQLRRAIQSRAQAQKQIVNDVCPRLLEYTDLNSADATA
jgi:hypothetical protein